MSDFERLNCLQEELNAVLNERMNIKGYIPKTCCKAKIHRLRLELNEVMLRIEHACNGYYKTKETWYD
uniref:Uncharacterized protein n=1 Tax=Siphoviridae sp. ctv4j104 TaxID=2826510 RepID=A0A8S5M9L0_9CAUD|nr:MAG TPA: hypothetical protein [Siphoviridae sp. ctv4j104]